MSPRRDTGTLAAVGALYARERPALVHHVTIKPVLYGSIVARVLGIPAVNAVSGLGSLFLDPSLAGRARRVLIEHAYRGALSHPRSTTIFQNEDDRSVFTGARLVRPEQTEKIAGSGVDPERFPCTAQPTTDVPTVVLPARMLWDKGVGEFVDAARRLRGRARFALVGRLDDTNPTRIPLGTLQSWVREGVVEWWGHRDDMPAVFAQAALVVLPSYREGLPLALLEAASSGRACVSTDVAGCRDAVQDGVTGWLIPPRDAVGLADAIAAALADPAERDRRGQAGAARARAEFSRAAVVDAHLAIYERLLAERGPRRPT
jgi:glycosyltransferase involved in cell wall biosynthesis